MFWYIIGEQYYKISTFIEDDMCLICHDESNEDVCELNKCKHKYHIQCIILWLKVKTTCPYCTVSLN